ncbi:hypothetical protein COJ96_06865 [Bacillus sp. AFS073361]|uniref:hypothetical protein n=1 Tax=Bacillus sp. AFS073361 TaxID=2033511 RepID=UPI000BF4A9CF|nr:hypothetical protein [Bacillus sp. AFS073361]PFP30134.1 hypothetical protein COJ96_06865 [Bacillus sp. AFS073361]
MSFNLQATLRLHDGFSSPARGIMRSASSMAGNISKLTGMFAGLGAAIGSAAAARKIFDSTVLEAAKYEQSTVVINAMLNDKELGKQYMDLVNKFAIDSPIFNSQDMLGNSKSFISITKDMKQLEQLWSLAERLSAVDPVQGLEGAVFALRELASGDSISMVRRFEMPKKIMNDIKKMELPEQLKALDKYFSKIGLTQRLIDDMGGTTLGIFAQIKEKLAVIFRDMGAPALGVIKKFLDGLNNGISGGSLSGFQKTGAKMLENVATGFVNASTGIGKWIDRVRNNEEFKKKSTIFGQVKWVMSDIFKTFIKWLDGGGSKQIADTVNTLFQSLSAVIEATTEVLLPVATKVGAAIGSGVIAGFNAAVKDSWMLQILSGDSVGAAINKVKSMGVKKAVGSLIDKKKGESRAGGLSYVPHNGAQYTLHKGERILTPEENKEYTNGNGRAITFEGGIHIHGVGGNLEKAADKLMDIIANKIQAAGGAGA